jgi:zinc protease
VTAATDKQPARTVQQYAAASPDGWNAQTGDDYTVFATIFPPARTEQELAEAADRMRGVRIERSDLDRELPRIEQELRNMYEGFPSLVVMNQGRQLAGPLPHGGRRGGKIGDLKKVTTNSVQDWMDRYYKAGNAMLVLAGRFDPASVRGGIEDQFGEIPRGAGAVPETATRQPVTAASGVHEVKIQPVGQPTGSRIGLAWVAPRPADPLYPAFLVHVTRMQMTARQKAAAASEVPLVFRPLDDPDFVYFSVAVEPGETTAAATSRLRGLVRDSVSAEFHSWQPAQAANALALFLGTRELPAGVMALNPYGVAFAAGRRHQLGIDPESLRQRLQQVDSEQMQRAAAAIFGEARGVVVRTTPQP